MPRWTNPKRRGMPPKQLGSASIGTGWPGVLESFHRFRMELLARGTQLDQQIAGIDRLLASIHGPGSKRAASNARAGSLRQHLEQVLQRSPTPLAISDIVRGVLANGFKSSNKTLATTVGIMLKSIPGARRVSRGVYELR